MVGKIKFVKDHKPLKNDNAPWGAAEAGNWHGGHCNASLRSWVVEPFERTISRLLWLEKIAGINRSSRPALHASPAETRHPSLEWDAIKSEAKTESKFQALLGGSVRRRPLQVLGVEPLEFHAAVWTDKLPQTWRRADQTRDFHSECLFAGRTAGKRVSALHTEVSQRA